MKEEYKVGFFQAIGVGIYCGLVAVVLWKANEIFGKVNNYFGPLAFLVLFSTSALACGLIVFYKPYKLFFEGKKKEAIDVVFSTAIFLFIILAILFVVLFLTK